MALVVTKTDLEGNTKVVYGDHVMPSSYVTGGDPSDPGLRIIHRAEADPETPDGRLYQYDYVNKKWMPFKTGSAVSTVFIQEAAATNLSAVKLKCKWWGE